MRCKKEEFIEGTIFHIYNHSVNEIDLFYEESDYEYFLDKLKKNFSPNEMGIFAYCLMPNHFHFCIKQKSDRPIYEVFNRFIVSYALHYNAKYKRKGKLFANKLQHKKVNDDEYLFQICPYIHLNPKRARLVKNLEEWDFSNYHEWISKRNDVLFDDELLKELFGSPKDYFDYLKKFDDQKIREYLYNPSKP